MKRVLAVMLSVLLTVTTLMVTPAAALGESDILTVSDLKVNNLTSPLGIDTTPTFRWLNHADGYGKAQSAYRIIVASTPEKAAAQEGDLWDSGKVSGENNYDISYEGAALTSRTPYYWAVQVWNEADAAGTWSDVACFETGVLNASEWTGQWISGKQGKSYIIDFNLNGANWIWSRYGAAQDQVPPETMYFRGGFTVDSNKTVDKVYVGMTTDDYGTVYINGQAGASVENIPNAWQGGALQDVAGLVKPGYNTVAADVTNTTVGYAGFIGKIEVRYTDGTRDTFVTDSGWKLTKTPASGWQGESFDDSSWETPDQVLSYGASPWGTQVTLPTEVKVTKDYSAPMLRRDFDVTREITRARAYVCGLGLFEMKVNGQLPDDTVLNPAHTQYEDTVNYRVFDVTSLLQSGKNAVTVSLGNSFYNCPVTVWDWQKAVWRDNPKLLMELTLEYADGTSETIVTDQNWKSYSEGPLTANDIYIGDTYDARLEVPGWELPDFDDSAWDDATLVSAPAGKLTFENMEPMRRIASFTPEITNMGGGTYILKNPVMATGWAKLSFDAPAGTEITITYGETLSGSGYLNKVNGWGYNLQVDTYTCKGEPGETFEPRFSYKGYEYIQIDNYPGELTAEDVECYLIASDVDEISSFQTSSEQINSLHDIMHRTMLNNMQGKPTDTPVWEKNGWTGDFNVSLETFNYNFDTTAFTTKFLGDLRDAADSRGVVPNIAPTANWGTGNTPVWNTVYINAIYEGWRANGLQSVAEDHYDVMRKQAIAYIDDIRANGWVWNDGQLADWVSPAGGTNPDAGGNASASEGSGICGTGYVYDALSRMAEMADKLGKTTDAAEYRAAMASIYDAFNAKFYNAEKGYYETTTWDGSTARTRFRQTSQLVPLAFGLCPDEYRDSVVASLLRDIEEKDYHLDTGMVGTKLLLPVLSDTGHADVAFRILTQESYPSWGFWLTKGTSSTWEGYENTTRSRDHYFLGTYDEWLYKHIAGIRDMTDGYRTVTIKPEVFGDLTYANCSVDTVRGTLQSNWSFTANDTLTMDIVIPAGTTASIYLPVSSADGVTVNGIALAEQAGISNVTAEDVMVQVTAGSGSYSFVMGSEGVAVSKNALKKVIKEAQALNETDYLASAWDTFAAVLARAEAMAEDNTVSQSAVNAMTEELTTAIETVQGQPDIPRKELGAAIGQADSFQSANYPAARWEAFQQEVDAARQLVDDRSATSEQLTAAKADLLAAMETLADFRLGNMALHQAVTASSTVNNTAGAGWHLSNLTDGDRLNMNGSEHCGWTSNNDTSIDHEEWVIVDLGSLSKFNNVQLMPTGCSEKTNLCESFPKDFTIDVSTDGVAWTTVLSESDYPVPEAQMQSFSFDTAYARYVRVNATSLRPKAADNGLYRMQLAELEVYRIRGSADMDALREAVNTASLLKAEDYHESAWNRFAPVLEEANALLLEGSDDQDAVDAMTAKLQAAAAELQQYRLGNLAEGAAVSVSSTMESAENNWSKNFLTDGDRANISAVGEHCGWTSHRSDDAENLVDHVEWAQLDLGATYPMNQVDLYPTGNRADDSNCYNFPKDFVIEVSSNGTDWTAAVSKTDYPMPVADETGWAPVESFTFDQVKARYVRVYATSLRPKASDGNRYRMQLAEIEVYNTAVEPETAVLSAAVTDPADGSVIAGKLFTMQVTTTTDVTALRLYNEYGLRMGLRNVSFTDQDGVRTWTLSASIGTAGTQRTLTVGGVGPDGEFSSDVSVGVCVKAPAPVVVSAVMDADSCRAGVPVSMTVVTDDTVSKLRVYNLYGLKMGTLSQSYVEEDGQRIWTVTMKIGTPGVRTFLVSGVNRYGDVSDSVETDSITVTYF